MSRALTIAGYLAAVVVAVAVDLLARRRGARLATAGELFSRLSSRRAGRVAVAFGWWWLGWHFFVR
ncbi:MAG TPA: DUF6186 family protein [Mycobacteriales bacterium]|nr:DUF6186 family protein [Mycobacteriales bacterium]